MQLKDLDWKGIGESVAKLGLPLLGSAIAGPAGGAVGAALASAIPGGEKAQSPQDVVQLLSSSADALQKAKEFEATHREHLMQTLTQYELTLAQAELEDRKSARQAATDTKAKTPAVLSWCVVVGNFIIYGYLLKYGNPTALDDVILGRILGTVDVAFGIVLNFWLGTSFSSRAKDSTISKLAS